VYKVVESRLTPDGNGTTAWWRPCCFSDLAEIQYQTWYCPILTACEVWCWYLDNCTFKWVYKVNHLHLTYFQNKKRDGGHLVFRIWPKFNTKHGIVLFWLPVKFGDDISRTVPLNECTRSIICIWRIFTTKGVMAAILCFGFCWNSIPNVVLSYSNCLWSLVMISQKLFP